MRSILALAAGIVIGMVVAWYLAARQHDPKLKAAEKEIQVASVSARDMVQDKLRLFGLTGADISNEMARTGRVIRQEAQEAGRIISDATADARVTTAIKAKLLRDPTLSAWDISVNTTGGIVTLSGSVSSAENVGKAMLLALETDGVHQVISTLQVKSK